MSRKKGAAHFGPLLQKLLFPISILSRIFNLFDAALFCKRQTYFNARPRKHPMAIFYPNTRDRQRSPSHMLSIPPPERVFLGVVCPFFFPIRQTYPAWCRFIINSATDNTAATHHCRNMHIQPVSRSLTQHQSDISRILIRILLIQRPFLLSFSFFYYTTTNLKNQILLVAQRFNRTF